jgi:uncharacterized protein YciI
MYYFIHAIDKPDSLEVRKTNRDAHLEYVKDFSLFIGGPTLTADYETMTGSVIIVDLGNDAALADFLENDPYNKAGLFSSVTTSPWKRSVYNPDV